MKPILWEFMETFQKGFCLKANGLQREQKRPEPTQDQLYKSPFKWKYFIVNKKQF